MAVKSKTKSKTKPRAKTVVKPKFAKTKSVKKTDKLVQAKSVKAPKPQTAKTPAWKSPAEPVAEKKQAAAPKPALTVVKRTVEPRPSPIRRIVRPNQFSYMRPPGSEYEFEVGDTVEVFCDHEKSRERVRGWIKGIVVQVDYKMVAVQFRSNVFLTDGWMVPDRILWYPLNSEHIRALPGKKPAVKKELIPDY